MPKGKKGGLLGRLTGLTGEALAEVKTLHDWPARDRSPMTITENALSPTSRNEVQQMDLLFLPQDPSDDEKYLLVVIDVASRRVGAVPLAAKDSATIRLGLIKIYRDEENVLDGLRPPGRMEVDAGTEFKGSAEGYLKRMGTEIRIGLPGRHKNQSLAENVNQVVGDALGVLMEQREKRTGKVNRDWVADVPQVIAALNEEWEVDPRDMKAMALDKDKIIKKAMAGKTFANTNQKDKSQKILPVGKEVHVALQRPEDLRGKKLKDSGTKTGLRSGDLKFEAKTRKITALLLVPNEAPRYFVEGIKETTFSRNEVRPA